MMTERFRQPAAPDSGALSDATDDLIKDRGVVLGRLVDQLHLHCVHTATVHFGPGYARIDLAKVFRRQLNIDRAQVLVEMIHVPSAWDRNNPRLLRYQPCQ